MDLLLIGKRAWITGGSSGIGLAIAKSLAKEGAEIVLSSRSAEKLEKARAQVLKENPTAVVECFTVDMLSDRSVAECAAKVSKTKPIDILIINTGGPAAGPALGITLENWDEGYRNLLRGAIQLTQLVVPGMKQKKWGRILTITSTSAKELIPRLPVSGVFRAGLSSWAKSCAKELGRDGILVNNLLPGPVKTERLEELSVSSPEFYRSMEERSAVGRIGEPHEVADWAAFLVSGRNTYLTGTDVLVDGGATFAI